MRAVDAAVLPAALRNTTRIEPGDVLLAGRPAGAGPGRATSWRSRSPESA